MLEEMKNVVQKPGEHGLRWYRDDYFDLYVWLDSSGAITGFQLCYGKPDTERALTWLKEKGFAHHQVDPGDQAPTKNRTPILVPDGLFPHSDVMERFEDRCRLLEPELSKFVKHKVQDFKEDRHSSETVTITKVPQSSKTTSPALQTKSSTSEIKFGAGLIFAGLVFQVLGPILIGEAAATIHASLRTLGGQFGLLMGMIICGIGMWFNAKRKSIHTLWAFLAVVPLLGPIIYLIGANIKEHTTAVVVGTGILVLIGYIAIQNMFVFQKKARQSEAKVILRNNLHPAVLAYKEKHGTFELTNIASLGFQVKAGSNYSYWYAVNGIPTRLPGSSEATAPCDVTRPPSVTPSASIKGFVAVAKGNIDWDPACDEWTINELGILSDVVDDVFSWY